MTTVESHLPFNPAVARMQLQDSGYETLSGFLGKETNLALAQKLFNTAINDNNFFVLELFYHSWDLDLQNTRPLEERKLSFLFTSLQGWNTGTLIDLSIILDLLLQGSSTLDEDNLRQLSPEAQQLFGYYFQLRPFLDDTLITQLANKLNQAALPFKTPEENLIFFIVCAKESEATRILDEAVSATTEQSTPNKEIRRKPIEIMGQKIQLNYTRETRRYNAILESAAHTGKISFKDMEAVCAQTNITYAELKIWIHFTLKAMGYTDTEASYDKFTCKSDDAPFAFSATLLEFGSFINRLSKSGLLLNTLQKARATYKRVVNENIDFGNVGLNFKVFICKYCGLPQRVAMLEQNTPNILPCSACDNTTAFEMIGVKKISRRPLTEADIQNIKSKLNEVAPSEQSNLLRDELSKSMTLLEVQLWFDRCVLQSPEVLDSDGISKFPNEMTTLAEGKTSMIRDGLAFLTRRHVPMDKIVDSLLPKIGNRHLKAEFELVKTSRCYCGDCKDVWVQPYKDTPELTQLSDNPIYDLQEFGLPEVTCGNCSGTNIHSSADFQPDWSEQLPKITNVTELRLFIIQHFALDEIKIVLARFAGTTDAYEDLGGSDVRGKAREMILKKIRVSQLTLFLGELLVHRIDSLSYASHVAVKCSYCNTIAITKSNREGKALLDYCPRCANIDGWKLYPTEIQNPKDFEHNLYEVFGRESIKYDGQTVTLLNYPHMVDLSEIG